MSDNVYVLAHGVDVDGIACHALAKKYFNSNGKKTIHKYITYQNFRDKLKEVVDDLPETEIIIADIGYNKSYDEAVGNGLNIYEMLEKLSEKNTINWFDHHKWSEEEKERYRKLLSVLEVDKTKCGAELVYNHYLKDDNFAMELSKIAHVHDFGDSSDSEKLLPYKLQDVISGCDKKDNIVDTLSKGILWDNDFENIYENYQQTKKEAFEILDKHTEYYPKDELNIAISYIPDILDSKPVRKHILNSDVDVFIGLWKDGRMAWEIKNEELSPILNILKDKFEGGGRALAGGGTYKNLSINKDNYRDVFRDILKSI